MHRAALAAHQAVVAAHQFAEHLLDRHAARQRVRMTAIGAERQIARLHRGGEAGRDRFLPERQMARALDQVLQEQVVGALLGFAQQHLRAVQFEPRVLADIVVQAGLLPVCRVWALSSIVVPWIGFLLGGPFAGRGGTISRAHGVRDKRQKRRTGRVRPFPSPFHDAEDRARRRPRPRRRPASSGSARRRRSDSRSRSPRPAGYT